MKTRLVAAGAAALIAGCGGGGGGNNSTPAAAPNPTAAGQYIGLTADNRALTTIVLDTGKVYSQYSVAGQPDVITGFVAGTVQSSSGTPAPSMVATVAMTVSPAPETSYTSRASALMWTVVSAVKSVMYAVFRK